MHIPPESVHQAGFGYHFRLPTICSSPTLPTLNELIYAHTSSGAETHSKAQKILRNCCVHSPSLSDEDWFPALNLHLVPLQEAEAPASGNWARSKGGANAVNAVLVFSR